jgi:hypothetical protein
LYRRLGGPQGQSGQVWKISPPPAFDSQVVDGHIHMQKQMGTILQLFAGNTENVTEEKMLANVRSNRHTKINVEFFICVT